MTSDQRLLANILVYYLKHLLKLFIKKRIGRHPLRGLSMTADTGAYLETIKNEQMSI